jgi:hypothetical protein
MLKKLRANKSSQSLRLNSSMVKWGGWNPLLFTRQSSRPKLRTAACTREPSSGSRVTLQETQRDLLAPGSALSSATVAAAAAVSMSATTTLAPAAANACQVRTGVKVLHPHEGCAETCPTP